MSELHANGGVLIIGSLLWQNHLSVQNDDIRKNWRSKYLKFDAKISVKCPIRYGRKSSSGIYTMVFSKNCIDKKLGFAYIVPFKNDKNSNALHLIELSKGLSTAEGMKGDFVTGGNSTWGVLGILINPSTESDLKGQFLSIWESQYSKERKFDPQDFRLGSEDVAVLKNGILNIPWPTAANSNDQNTIDSLDFVLAAVTKPTDYPHISDLLVNVNSDLTRKYFLNNVANGIRTFQDHYILEKIDKNILESMNIETPA